MLTIIVIIIITPVINRKKHQRVNCPNVKILAVVGRHRPELNIPQRLEQFEHLRLVLAVINQVVDDLLGLIHQYVEEHHRHQILLEMRL